MSKISKPQPAEQFQRDVIFWDDLGETWRTGKKTTILSPEDLITIAWTDTGANTDVTPDTDTEIDVQYAQRIILQIDSTNSNNTSTDFDVNIESSLDGKAWDTEPYAERNIGDGKILTFLVTPGPKRIRLRGDNNDAGTTGYITVRVFVMR